MQLIQLHQVNILMQYRPLARARNATVNNYTQCPACWAIVPRKGAECNLYCGCGYENNNTIVPRKGAECNYHIHIYFALENAIVPRKGAECNIINVFP